MLNPCEDTLGGRAKNELKKSTCKFNAVVWPDRVLSSHWHDEAMGMTEQCDGGVHH